MYRMMPNLNVLGHGVEDRILRQFDGANVVA